MVFPIQKPAFMRHIYRLMLIALVSALTAIGLSAAQAASPTPAAAQPTLNTPLSRDEAQRLLSVLNNPQERDQFARTLSLMARAAPPASTSASSPSSTPTLDKSLLPDLHSGFNSLRNQVWRDIGHFFSLFNDVRYVGIEAHKQLSSPSARAAIISTLTKTALIFIIGLALEYGASVLLRRPVHYLTSQAFRRDTLKRSDTSPDLSGSTTGEDNEKTEELRAADQRRQAETVRFLARIPYACGFFGLKIAPIAVFYLLSLGAFLLIPWDQTGGDVFMNIVNIYAVTRCLYLCGETILAPHASTIRLLPVMDTTARLLTRWWKYLIIPLALIVVLTCLGDNRFIILPRGADALIRIIVFIEHLLIAVFIWRVRHIVSRFLTPNRTTAHTVSFWSVLGAIARLWWIPALLLDVSLWTVWAAQLPGGYHWIIRATLATIATLVLFRIVAIMVYGAQNTLFRLKPSLVQRFPDLQKRADRYYPMTRRLLTAILIAITAVTIANIWGLPSYGFFLHNPLGNHIFVTLLILLTAAISAVLIWEGINLFLLQQLAHFEQNGMLSRATRLKTVLPIIRTVMLALIIIIVTVTTLSQMGINVTPLLTGAGIMGAAIAFGSQSLVKDFITGFFMLVEDAIQVGDWVTTSGVSGTVENLSIRTVRIRDSNGDLHIIPFSSVNSITNTARGYNKIVIKQQLALSEDFARVVALMSDVVTEMRQDDTFGPMILSDYTDLGVDDSGGSGAILVGSILTQPMMKWKVKREFNRRISNRFASEGINFYTSTSYITTPPNAPFHTVQDGVQPRIEPSSQQSSQS
ncbi:MULTISPECIES: mechanosensitive ion channel family protein [unclassified Saccharibacter]|uniref:mechanosensitive ion channel family protein n=1 Tax=unclassified Saccharibacter TaxID=2648722 RepID=UPI00132B7F6D|nr:MULTISPECIES: mechanosensitive ion channel domain-containing protein [unclassified Saccharibacter]MXV36959.1 mechanosensitive ion channel [Saccharibacter sp. EH611]MXV58551.1 mechanosensitive ion channel [Saccharibacter sp. EH70]MXV66057.1 mechanosensitive ion channel [Saccharibacter sp. EH60]